MAWVDHWYYETCWKLRRISSVVIFTLGITVFASCFSIAYTNNSYTGGISFAYFSDVGRDSPAYYLFALCLSIISVCTAISTFVQYNNNHAWIVGTTVEEKGHALLLNKVLLCSGLVYCISLFVFSIYDGVRFSGVHYVAYIISLCASTLFGIVANIICYQLCMSGHHEFWHPFIIRTILSCCIVIIFILSLPVGIPILCENSRLSMEDCIRTEKLGEIYCHEWEMDGSGGELTMLWNYSNCPAANQLHASLECISIFLTFVYFVSLCFEPDYSLEMVHILESRRTSLGSQTVSPVSKATGDFE